MSTHHRNDPCPCGSGKKYKQCCLKRDEYLAANKCAETASIPAIQTALEHHQAGRLSQAEVAYQQILRAEPNHPDALHLLGLLAHQVGRNEIAVELIGKAVSVSPSGPMYSNLGLVFQAQGKLDEAVEHYRKALLIQPDFAEVFSNLGIALKDQGKLDAAVESFQRALSLKPDFAEAHSHLGVTLQAQDKLDGAIEHYRKALSLKPGFADAHCNLGLALQAQGKLDEAVEHYRKALSVKPDFAEAHSNLGDAFQAQGKLDEAVEHYRKALSIKPDFADAHNNLGNAFREQGKLDEAVEHCRKALSLKPDFAEALSNLGLALQEQGKPDEAVEHCRKVLSLKPDFAEAHCHLGLALQDQGKLDEAVEHYRKAFSLKPDFAEAHYNLGNAFKEQGKLEEAVESFHRALSLKPDFAEAHYNLGNVLREQGRLDAAIESFYRALSIKPDFAGAYSNLLFALNYHPDLGAEEIYRAYQEFDTQMGIPLRPTWRAHSNDRNPHRRLRVAYVSPDFYNHACHFFLEPLLAHHDKTQVEIYAYAELGKEDEVSIRYQSYVEHWVPTKGMSDEALAERIRSDGIDILVELAGHTAGNRLLTFARKPAPVSLSWLGYGYTTGLSAIDYYLTDAACVPAGNEGLFAEYPWRIATPGYVYRPKTGMGEVNSLPAQQRGCVTFGSLTRALRVNHRTIRVWAEILNAVPNSRLVMDSINFKEHAMQERMAACFAEHGIARERLEIGYHSPPWDVLRGIDIGLDCFPHNSGTTLFETLYMGVPYITLAGRPSVGRLGGSILHGIGHPEWIANNEDEYVAKAVQLASDTGRLAEIRASLRGEMERSPLMDEAGFARKVETAYREMWKIGCAQGG